MNKLKRNTNELEDLDDADIDEFLDFAYLFLINYYKNVS